MMSKMGGMDMGPKMGGMDMGMGGMSSDMSSMSSSSFSSSSSSSFSSSSSSMMSSDMSSMMGGMPPMRGMQMPSMPGLSFKEMPDMPPMPAASPAPSHPEYTVTSPPMSPPPEMNHKVSKSQDYVPPSASRSRRVTNTSSLSTCSSTALRTSPSSSTVRSSLWRPMPTERRSNRATSFPITSTWTRCPPLSPLTAS